MASEHSKCDSMIEAVNFECSIFNSNLNLNLNTYPWLVPSVKQLQAVSSAWLGLWDARFSISGIL